MSCPASGLLAAKSLLLGACSDLAASRKRDKCGPRTGLGLLEGDVGPACLAKCQVRGGNWGFFLNPPPNLGKLLVPARLCEKYCAFR